MVRPLSIEIIDMKIVKERMQRITEICQSRMIIDFYTENSEAIYVIDPVSDTCEYHVSVTAACGCCGESEHRETELSYMVSFMSDSEFEDFIQHIKQTLKTH